METLSLKTQVASLCAVTRDILAAGVRGLGRAPPLRLLNLYPTSDQQDCPPE